MRKVGELSAVEVMLGTTSTTTGAARSRERSPSRRPHRPSNVNGSPTSPTGRRSRSRSAAAHQSPPRSSRPAPERRSSRMPAGRGRTTTGTFVRSTGVSGEMSSVTGASRDSASGNAEREAWATSGAMALTGARDGPPLSPGWSVASFMARMANDLVALGGPRSMARRCSGSAPRSPGSRDGA